MEEVEKRRATVFESKVERKRRRGWEVARDSSYEEETATVDYRRFENLWTRPSLFPSLPHWVRRIRPNARKKRNLHERTWALHCIAVVTDASKEISFFSLSLRMETSRHFFHHGLIQCLLTRTSHFPLIRRYFACTPAYNFPSNLSLLPLNVECSSNDPARRWRCVSFRISIFALYSVVGIGRSKKFSKSSTFISYIRVCVCIYICVRELMRVGGKKKC